MSAPIFSQSMKRPHPTQLVHEKKKKQQKTKSDEMRELCDENARMRIENFHMGLEKKK